MLDVKSGDVTDRANAVLRLLNPRSVAIIGMSAKSGAPGLAALATLDRNEFAGDIYLVGRSGGTFGSRVCLTDTAGLPKGIDLALLTLPANAILEAIRACIAQGVKAALIFASGFAETGDAARAQQVAIVEEARQGGLVVLGPNCIGLTNYGDGFCVNFMMEQLVPKLSPDVKNAVAIIGQSGGLLGSHVLKGLAARGVPISYLVTTGNESDLDTADFVRHVAGDAATSAIAIYAEQIARPDAFLEAAKLAKSAGKTIVLLHPGRGQNARAAMQSHTGALMGDHLSMRAVIEDQGVIVVDTLEELLDVSEIVALHPAPLTKGVGIMTASGAFCAYALDFCESIGLNVPPLSQRGAKQIEAVMPPFVSPHNPLDVTTQAATQPEIIRVGLQGLLAEEANDSILISFPSQGPFDLPQLQSIHEWMEHTKKPVIMNLLGDTAPLAGQVLSAAAAMGIIISRSSERSLRALSIVTSFGRRAASRDHKAAPEALAGQHRIGAGPQAEWVGKKLLASRGVRVPTGSLAVTRGDARRIAHDIGYPVVAKVQAAQITHKTEVGGIVLSIGDDASLDAAWDKLQANVARAKPGVQLDGILIETMGARGTEMIVGGKRDPLWGPVLMIGLGGIWIEALGDVRILPVGLSDQAIMDKILQLKGSKLLTGFRGAPPADLTAVAKVVTALGALMMNHPEIVEVDVNPLVVYAEGEGATALDALIICNDDAVAR